MLHIFTYVYIYTAVQKFGTSTIFYVFKSFFCSSKTAILWNIIAILNFSVLFIYLVI